MKYIQLFDNHEQYLTNVVPESNLLTLCKHENHVHHDIANDDYANECFSIKILSGTNAEIRLNYDPTGINTNAIYVSRVKVRCDITTGEIYGNEVISNVTKYSGSAGVISINNLQAGDQIWLYWPDHQFKQWTTTENDTTTIHSPLTFETVNCTISVQGNIMSLFTNTADNPSHPNLVTDAEVASSETGQNYDRLCMKMFQSQQVINAHNLILPLKTLRIGMYHYMFASTPIKTVPQLPATTLANSCYYAMFYNCRQLEDVSYLILPASRLEKSCYRSMFSTCTSLKEVMPEIHGSTAQTSSDSYSFHSMFNNTAITSAPKLNFGNIGRFACTYMFQNCKSLTDATYFNWSGTAYQYACIYMFNGCEKLVNVFPKFKTGNITSQWHFRGFFQNCKSLEVAPKVNINTLNYGQFHSCFKGCTKLRYIDASAVTDKTADYCCTSWVEDVASSGEFIKNSNTTWTLNHVSGIPSGWTVYEK